MMCYKLAAEAPDRVVAIAPVAGTMTEELKAPARPVSVIHFHGTRDGLVPFGGLDKKPGRFMHFLGAEASVRAWARADGCPDTPRAADEPDRADDGTRVRRLTFGPGRDGSEAVLIVIEEGGHTWPGAKDSMSFLGKTTRDVSANDLMAEFFQKHARRKP
jgi:polyhydroxybutyrate depolymerase